MANNTNSIVALQTYTQKGYARQEVLEFGVTIYQLAAEVPDSHETVHSTHSVAESGHHIAIFVATTAGAPLLTAQLTLHALILMFLSPWIKIGLAWQQQASTWS